MNPPPSPKVSWTVFLVAELLAAVFVNQTWTRLPEHIAVHFDADGQAASFMGSGQYRVLILLFAVALPCLLVALMARAYSRAKELKLPNRDYWMAPQRIARTRAFLTAHGIWFGTLLVGLMCFMHWLILDANRRQPPQLPNDEVFLGLLIMLGCMIVWIGTLMFAFRRPK